ncbi:MAG: hypothetical protein LBJ59_12250 [Zoogloeaceae bacterium]|jgi:hypothetical protein|nr:hypothetical protein [Zoogloeaceae bacterium]
MNDEYDPTSIFSSRQADAEAKRRIDLEAESEVSDWEWLMSDKRGRRVVWRLLERAGVLRSSFATDPLIMAFNEGRRDYGNYVFSVVNAVCPEFYRLMQEEAKNGR